MTRAEKVAAAQRIQAEGLTVRDVARRMGVPFQTAGSWLADPDLSKQRARRARYQGTCVDCGAPTDGSNGRAKAPERCDACARKHSRYWTRERIREAIQRWAREHGRPPRSRPDWANAGPYHPAFSNVFGPRHPYPAWADAIEDAGFARPEVGRYERTPETRAKMSASQQARYVREKAAA